MIWRFRNGKTMNLHMVKHKPRVWREAGREGVWVVDGMLSPFVLGSYQVRCVCFEQAIHFAMTGEFLHSGYYVVGSLRHCFMAALK